MGMASVEGGMEDERVVLLAIGAVGFARGADLIRATAARRLLRRDSHARPRILKSGRDPGTVTQGVCF